jgi:hypothetical protein
MTCVQPLLIHADGTGSCSVPGCLDQDTLTEAVLRHRYVVNCQAVLGDRCTLCHRQSRGSGATGPAGPASRGTDVMCPGVALVHADLSLECSAPDCATNASRGVWLARHADLQSCADLTAACPLCAVSGDVT